MAAADAGRLHTAGGREVGGPEAHALDAGAGAGDLLEVSHALGRLQHAVDQDRTFDPGLCLQLGEQAVGVVDVPRALDLRDHHDLELVADLGDELREIVEHERRGELVDARPQRRVAEIHLAAHLDQARTGGLLLFKRDGILEVAEQDVHLRGEDRRLLDHFRVREVHEVDHPGRLEGDLARRLGSVDGEGLEEVSGVAQVGSPVALWLCET
jgi:hypothetical protein